MKRKFNYAKTFLIMDHTLPQSPYVKSCMCLKLTSNGFLNPNKIRDHFFLFTADAQVTKYLLSIMC